MHIKPPRIVGKNRKRAKVEISFEPAVLEKLDSFVVPGKTRSELVNRIVRRSFNIADEKAE